MSGRDSRVAMIGLTKKIAVTAAGGENIVGFASFIAGLNISGN